MKGKARNRWVPSVLNRKSQSAHRSVCETLNERGLHAYYCKQADSFPVIFLRFERILIRWFRRFYKSTTLRNPALQADISRFARPAADNHSRQSEVVWYLIIRSRNFNWVNLHKNSKKSGKQEARSTKFVWDVRSLDIFSDIEIVTPRVSRFTTKIVNYSIFVPLRTNSGRD